MNYWLFKSEPHVFGIDDLERAQASVWDGVRNYQARNYLRTAQIGDLAFFYHSSTQPTGIVGTCAIIETNIADPSQFDPQSKYFDPKSTLVEPRWQTVKVHYQSRFPRILSLDELKATFTGDEFALVRKGMRLSVMPVSEPVAKRILDLATTPS